MIFLKAIRTIITFMDIYICINNQNDYSDGKSQPFFSWAKSCCYKYNIALHIYAYLYIATRPPVGKWRWSLISETYFR
jgi:hypothetical protein